MRPFCPTYILIGQTPVPEPDKDKWTEWFEDVEHRIVCQTEVGSSVVSTVFIGIDLREPPRLFETMIFTDGEPGFSRRCSTWLEAEQQHNRIVADLKAAPSHPRG
jgi:hypothetical protein